MADAQVSDACGSNTVWVQIPFPAPAQERRSLKSSLFFLKWVFTKDLIYAIIITRDNYELQTKN